MELLVDDQLNEQLNDQLNDQLNEIIGENIKIISFIGAARMGKSSFINAYINSLHNCISMKGHEITKLCISNNLEDGTKSISVIKIKLQNYTLVIIDTPGLGYLNTENDYKILLLCYYLSDIIIFNCSKILDINALKSLEQFVSIIPHCETINKTNIELLFRIGDFDLKTTNLQLFLDKLFIENEDSVKSTRKTIKLLFNKIDIIATMRPEITHKQLLDLQNYEEFNKTKCFDDSYKIINSKLDMIVGKKYTQNDVDNVIKLLQYEIKPETVDLLYLVLFKEIKTKITNYRVEFEQKIKITPDGMNNTTILLLEIKDLHNAFIRSVKIQIFNSSYMEILELVDDINLYGKNTINELLLRQIDIADKKIEEITKDKDTFEGAYIALENLRLDKEYKEHYYFCPNVYNEKELKIDNLFFKSYPYKFKYINMHTRFKQDFNLFIEKLNKSIEHLCNVSVKKYFVKFNILSKQINEIVVEDTGLIINELLEKRRDRINEILIDDMLYPFHVVKRIEDRYNKNLHSHLINYFLPEISMYVVTHSELHSELTILRKKLADIDIFITDKCVFSELDKVQSIIDNFIIESGFLQDKPVNDDYILQVNINSFETWVIKFNDHKFSLYDKIKDFDVTKHIKETQLIKKQSLYPDNPKYGKMRVVSLEYGKHHGMYRDINHVIVYLNCLKYHKTNIDISKLGVTLSLQSDGYGNRHIIIDTRISRLSITNYTASMILIDKDLSTLMYLYPKFEFNYYFDNLEIWFNQVIISEKLIKLLYPLLFKQNKYHNVKDILNENDENKTIHDSRYMGYFRQLIDQLNESNIDLIKKCHRYQEFKYHFLEFDDLKIKEDKIKLIIL